MFRMPTKVYCNQWKSDDQQSQMGNTLQYNPQFCKQLCENSEICHLLRFVRNKLGALTESYVHVNITRNYITTVLQYIAYQNNGTFV